MKSLIPLSLVAMLSSASAGIVLTEIDLATGDIELTNTDAAAFSGTQLQWCIPFVYGTLETGGFSYAPGESRVYSTGQAGLTADDFWVFLDNSGFNDESQVTTGIVFGSDQSGQGRVSAVVGDTSGAAWASATDFVAVGGMTTGQTLKLNPGGPNANVSSNWAIGDSDMGTYELQVPEPSGAMLLSCAGLGLVLRRRRS